MFTHSTKLIRGSKASTSCLDWTGRKTVGSSLRVNVDDVLLTLVFAKNWIQVGPNCGARSNSQGYIPLPEPAPSHHAGPFGFYSFLCANGHKFSMIRFRGGMRKAKDNLLHS